MTTRHKIFLIWLLLMLVLITYSVFACEEPISDKELAEKYYICKGGFCLKDSGK